MCTLSWLLNADGYEVYFNRDEQVTRSRGHAPLYKESLDAIFPIDPDGGGTWIALHRSGTTLCLLNDYSLPAGTPAGAVSRGLLIPSLLHGADDIARAISTMSLRSYAPFTLCHFPAGLTRVEGEASTYHWDGTRLTRSTPSAPVTSSSVDTDHVRRSRQDIYQRTTPEGGVERGHLLRFHASHLPSRSEQSVCMHRAGAQTVSLSHITVGPRSSFTYYDGPPCQVRPLPATIFPALIPARKHSPTC